MPASRPVQFDLHPHVTLRVDHQAASPPTGGDTHHVPVPRELVADLLDEAAALLDVPAHTLVAVLDIRGPAPRPTTQTPPADVIKRFAAAVDIPAEIIAAPTAPSAQPPVG
jgi:hypothetical protein